MTQSKSGVTATKKWTTPAETKRMTENFRIAEKFCKLLASVVEVARRSMTGLSMNNAIDVRTSNAAIWTRLSGNRLTNPEQIGISAAIITQLKASGK